MLELEGLRMQPTAYQTALSSHGGFLPGSTELSKINDDFITDLDDTVKLLCRMSQMEGGYYHITMHGCHPHCRAYYAQCMTNLADPFCFNADVDDVSLKRYVDQQFSCTTQTVYYFERTFTDPYCQINFVVFSSEQRILSDHLSDLINMYLDQRTQAFQGNLLRHKLTNQVQALEDINLGRTKYLSVIAHDLRAHFHGILGCADILSHERTTLDEEATQRLINYIYDTTQSTYGLLENLLNWSMEEGGRFHQKCIEFDLKQRIEFVISLLNGLAFKK